MAAMMRSLSSCLDATRMWRKTERASLENNPSMRLSQEQKSDRGLDRRAHVHRSRSIYRVNAAWNLSGNDDQIVMSRTPGAFRTVLAPRGSSKPEWLTL